MKKNLNKPTVIFLRLSCNLQRRVPLQRGFRTWSRFGFRGMNRLLRALRTLHRRNDRFTSALLGRLAT